MAVSSRRFNRFSGSFEFFGGGDQVDYATIRLVVGGNALHLAIALAELGR